MGDSSGLLTRSDRRMRERLPARLRAATRLAITSAAVFSVGLCAGSGVQLSAQAAGARPATPMADQAGAAGYFHDVEQAIEAAKSVVLIVDWSFHPVARLTPGDVTLGNCLGARLIRKANAGVTVAILTWYHGMAPKEPPNDNCQTIMNAIAADLGLGTNKVLWRGAVRKGVGWSHHQKFVLVDDGTEAPAGRARLKVYFGGIDLTQGRSDWGDHHNLPEHDAPANLLRTLQKGDR